MNLYTDPHQKKLLKKWGMILESGTPIKDQHTKVILAQVLENTRNFYLNKGMLNEAGVPEGGVNYNTTIGQKQYGVLRGQPNHPYRNGAEGYGDYYLPNVVMPMLRRIMPDLIANKLVAVQPLNGPVGFALAYRPTYGFKGTFGGQDRSNDSEIGYNPVDTGWTGAGVTDKDNLKSFDEALGPYADKEEFLSAYSGSESWYGEGASRESAEWAKLGVDYPTVSFGLVKTVVEAKTRKLAAQWSPELAEDMQAMHGIDVEREMVNTLTYEVGAEIDRQIVTEMVKAAIVGGSTSKWNVVSADGLDQMGRLQTLLTQISIESEQIAIKTKRGSANFVITTPRICGLLAQMGMNKYTNFKSNATLPSVPDTGVGALTEVGYINNDSQLLIRDAHVQSSTSDYILMGYKGKQVGDSGIIYNPYIPLQLQKIMQPDTFTYSIGARTRYGIMNNPFEAKNYYHFMKVEKLDNPYEWNTTRNFISTPSKLTLNGWNGGSPVMPIA